MKSFKKILAAFLAVTHVLTFSAPAQQINIQEGTTVNVDSIQVNSGEQLTINVLDQLGQVCPSCRGILETNSLLNNGAIDIWGILAIIAPTIINNGTITVQGDLLLSNLGINQAQFFAGIAELSKDPSLANGYILNTGEIKNLTQGLLALVAANGGVHNLGTISSNGGAVVLAAGDRASFPLTRDGVLNIDLGSVTGVKGQVFDKDGNLVETNGLVTNAGVLQANGGAVVLQAAGAEAIYDSIINHTGIIEAKSVAQENGKIILKSETGNIKVNNATIDASGYGTGEKGGSIELLTAGNIIVDGTSVLDASGDNGGGSILIGGDVQGSGSLNASNVGINSDVKVKADAVTSGNGGKIVVWSEGVTLAYGDFSAKGGAYFGNGGFIETSGKEYFDVDGIRVDASAPNGLSGEWLLDPATLTIIDSASTGNSSPLQLNPSLGDGQITVGESATNNTISWGKIASLAITTNIILQASGLITISNITGVQSGTSNLVSLGLTTGSLKVESTGGSVVFSDTNDVIRTNGGAINFTAGGGDLTLGGFNTGNAGGSGSVSLSATGDINTGAVISTNGGSVTATAGDRIDINSSITTSGGNVSLTANGEDSSNGIDIDAGINAGAGSINLNATAGTLEISNALTTNNNSITVSSTSDVNFNNAASDISTSGGAINITADSNANGSGTFNHLGDLGAGTSNITSGGGNITIVANDFNSDSDSVINAGDGTVFIKNSEAGRNFRLGSASSFFNISDSEADRIMASTLDIGSSTAGGITVGSFSPENVANLILRSNSDIAGTGSGNNVNVENLGLSAAGSVDLDIDVNNVAVSAGGAVTLQDSGSFSVGTVGGISGVTTTNDNIELTAADDLTLTQDVNAGTADVNLNAGSGSNDDINQTGGKIVADDLTFSAGDDVTLNKSANQFNSIDGSRVDGNINIADSGTNTQIKDLQTDGGSITYVHTGAGDVTVTGNVDTADGSTNGGAISLTSSNLLTIAATAVLNTQQGSGGGSAIITGSVTQSGSVTVGAGTITLIGGATGLDLIINSPISGAANVILTALRDIILNTSITTTGGASVSLTADSDLDGVGGLWLKNTGSIVSDGNVTLTGSAIFDAGAAGESIRIDADGTNNQILAAGDIILQKSSAAPSTADITVNGIVNTTGVNKTITVNSNDQINSSDNGVAEFVGANLNLTAKNGINVESNVTNASYNNSTSGNVAIEDMTGGLTITGATNGGSGSTTILTHSPLTIAANMIQAGTINLTANEAAGAGDDLTINNNIIVRATGAGSDVNLNAGDNVVLNAGSAVESVTDQVNITAGSGNVGAVGGDISLAGTVSAATTTTLSAALGAITQTGGSVVGPTLNLTAGATSALDQATNNAGTLNANVAGNLTYRDSNALNFGNSTVTGNLIARTVTGSISDSGVTNVNGTATFATLTANEDVLLDTLNAAGAVSVNTTGATGHATVRNAQALNLGASSIGGDFVAGTAVGNITDSGTIVVGDELILDTPGDVTLDNVSNNFGAVRVDAANNVTLNDINGINVGNSAITGFFTLTAGGLIDFIGNVTSTIGGAMNLTNTTGGITDSGTGSLTVTGSTTLAAGAANDITLNNANDFVGAVSVTSAYNVNLVDANNLSIGSIAAANGTTTLTATAGSITDANAAATNVTATSLIANATANIDLDTNVVNLTASSTAAGSISIDELNAINLADVDTANGSITINAGGTITATDVRSLTDADANDISLTATAGDITTGIVNAGAANGDVTLLATAGSITGAVASMITGDRLTLTAQNGIGTGGQALRTTGNSLDASVTAAGLINVNESNAITLTDVDTFNGGITVTAGGTITATDVVAGTAGSGAGNGNLNLTTTSGNILLGTVTALNDTATITSAGTIGELVNDDAGAQSSDVNAGTINLTTGGGDIGAFTSYLDITPTTLWNATSNGGGIYISCIGVCPMGQIDAGTGNFYYTGNIIDGNDLVNGEIAGGLWNIRAGGVHLNADVDTTSPADGINEGGIGTSTNWIEMRLARDVNSDTVLDANGIFVAKAATGGIHISNDVPSDASLGLQIGSVGAFPLVAGMNDGVTSTGGIEIYSFSPLVIAANVIDNSASSIDLVAAGNLAADDLTVNTGVTVDQQGSGTVRLFAGDSIAMNGTALVQSTSGNVSLRAGEDFADFTIDQDGNVGASGGDITMSDGSIARSTSGRVILDAADDVVLSSAQTGSNAGNAVRIDARAGAVSDAGDTHTDIITGTTGTVIINSVLGVGDGNALETSVGNVDIDNSTSGNIQIIEIGSGANLGIDKAAQGATGNINIRTTNGNLTVNANESGVSSNDGTITLQARDSGGVADKNLNVNDTVTSTTGKINLDAANNVNFSAAGDVTSTTGEIEVEGGTDAQFATGHVTMSDGTILSTGGIIDVDAQGNITLGSVQTTSTSNDAVNLNAVNGGVIDGGDIDVDIVAQNGRTNITAATGVGSAGQIDTEMKEVDVQNSTSGDIRIREESTGGNLDIIRADNLAATGDLRIRTEDGSLTVVAAGLGGLGVVAVDGVTRLFAADQNASGGDHLVLNNTVKSADGKINLDSENDVIASAAGDVTTGDTANNGAATGAEIEVDALGNITMADGTIFNANAGGPQGAIDMDANANITLGSVQTSSNANNAVVIVSQNGQIIDGGDTDTDIVTGVTGASHLVAETGIGSANGLETQMGQLAARTETGNIQIFNQGDMTVTSLTDNDNSNQTGLNGGTTGGVQITDPTNLNTGANFIFVTNNGNLTVNNDVSNLDGGDVSMYSFGNVGLGDMTINANVESIGANGDIRVVSGGNMTIDDGIDPPIPTPALPPVMIKTQGDGLTSGSGTVVVGAGFNVVGKARNADNTVNPLFAADVLPGLNATSIAPTTISTNGVGSLLDTLGDTNANLVMDETARISTEGGNIIVDAQNNFTVGRVDADGNAGANGLTDGVRGNILAFARNGSILDAEGPGEIGNLDFLANSLTMLAAGTIGLSNNRIEGTAPFLNTFSIGSQFISMLGDTQVEMNSQDGSIFLNATGTILLGHMSAPSGEVHANAGGSIISQGGGETRVTAANLIELIANNIVGTTSNPIHTHLNATPAQINLSAGGQAANGVSAAVFSNISPLAVNMLNNPPGLVLFNGTPVAGQALSGLIGSQASLYYKAFVRGLRQYGDFDGNYAADFPGFVDYQGLITSPDLTVDTTGLDIPLRGITTAPRVVPIPAPAVPTPVPPVAEQQPAVQPQVPELSAQEPTPPAVVPIPARAQPSDQATTDEGVPVTPTASN